MNIVLSLPPDDAADQWRRDNPDLHRGVAAGEVHIGFINLWIKRDMRAGWRSAVAARARCGSRASTRPRCGVLVALLADHKGIAGYIDRGDGSLAGSGQ
jgi:hypothetical protein